MFCCIFLLRGRIYIRNDNYGSGFESELILITNAEFWFTDENSWKADHNVKRFTYRGKESEAVFGINSHFTSHGNPQVYGSL